MQNQQEADINLQEQQQVQPEAEVIYNGYLNGSYTMGVDDPQTLQDNAEAANFTVSSEELASIASKLGVDVESLVGLLGIEKQQEEQQPPAAETEEQQTQEEKEKEEPEDEKLRERLLNVDKEVKELLGVGLQDVYGLLQDLQQFKAQYVVEQQTNILKREWGDDYQDTIREVKGYWEKLPPAQKQALDNVEGAKLIHALLVQERTSSAPTSVRQQNSQYVRQGSVKPRSGGTAKFRMSEIVKLSEADYIRIQPQLEEAFRRGQVVNDIR